MRAATLFLAIAALAGSSLAAPTAQADWYRGGPQPYGWHGPRHWGGPPGQPRRFYRNDRYGYGYGYRPYYPPRPPFYLGAPPVLVTPRPPVYVPQPGIFFGH